jgi:acyl-CoA synthetase (AMP-forming)/AMP-acid ligase II
MLRIDECCLPGLPARIRAADRLDRKALRLFRCAPRRRKGYGCRLRWVPAHGGTTRQAQPANFGCDRTSRARCSCATGSAQDLTDAAFSDGWFRTGDICRVDADGYFYYLDRKRHFIRRRGENISPFEVEGIVFDHPQVANCAVIGVPSDLGEEDVLLAVQARMARTVDAAALWRWCRERMAPYMTPRYIRVMRLPLTPSERVEKHKLREEGIQPGTFDAEKRGDDAPIRRTSNEREQ